ncbi:MAG: hypothetical protein BalsKO_19900 [Balneolaceae bacterium]
MYPSLLIYTQKKLTSIFMNSQANLSKYLLRLTIGTLAILMIPLIAMQFSDEVTWTPLDFVIAGGLIFGTGMSYVLISRLSNNSIYRVALLLALLSAFLLVWLNAAVGLVGSENDSFNLIYFGVLVILIVGAFISRFKATGMANTLFVTAVIQGSTILIALFANMHQSSESSVVEIILVNGFFVTLFSISGGLFWKVGNTLLKENE